MDVWLSNMRFIGVSSDFCSAENGFEMHCLGNDSFRSGQTLCERKYRNREWRVRLLFSHPAEPLYLFMLGKALDLVITEKIIFLFVEFSTNIKVSLSFRQ